MLHINIQEWTVCIHAYFTYMTLFIGRLNMILYGYRSDVLMECKLGFVEVAVFEGGYRFMDVNSVVWPDCGVVIRVSCGCRSNHILQERRLREGGWRPGMQGVSLTLRCPHTHKTSQWSNAPFQNESCSHRSAQVLVELRTNHSFHKPKKDIFGNGPLQCCSGWLVNENLWHSSSWSWSRPQSNSVAGCHVARH